MFVLLFVFLFFFFIVFFFFFFFFFFFQAEDGIRDYKVTGVQTCALPISPKNQVTGFLGAGVPVETQVWSKAGLTSKVRHDAAYIEADGAHPYLLVVFTEGAEHSEDEKILPFVSAQILAAMNEIGV